MRPGYPAQVLTAIIDRHGGVPASVAELGAGTSKARFPQVTVVPTECEQWTPPAAGVGLLACAMA